MPAGGNVRHRRWLPVAASLLALVVSACATLPGNSSVQTVRVASQAGGPNQANLQMIPVPPQPGWLAYEVVSGFLASLASFHSDPQAVRQYIAGSSAATWHPVAGTVVILGGQPATQEMKSPNSSSVAEQTAEVVTATGLEVADLAPNGQYVTDKPGQQVRYTFNLIYFGPNVGWRISDPVIPLLLTQQDFTSLYTPRNLYFVAGDSNALVPDPVFVPVQATSGDLASQLVSALLGSPRSWLATTVTTAFPVGTPPPQVTLGGGTATVQLSGPAARAGKAALAQMLAQVYWTLTSRSYDQQAIAQNVQLDVNGVVKASAGCCAGTAATGYTVPEVAPGASLYSIAAHGVILQLTLSPGGSVAVSSAPGQAGQIGPDLSSVAVSPDGKYIAAITASHHAVWYGRLVNGAKLARWSEGGRYTSISYDEQGNLWVSAPPLQVWRLRTDGTALPLTLQGLQQAGETMSQFQIAPDGVRYAIIVSRPGASSPQLQIGAITYLGGAALASQPQVAIGAGIIDPTDLTWYDADNLIVLAGSRTDPQLWEVPVDSESSASVVTAPGAQSVTAAGPGNRIVEGLANGRIALTSINGDETTIPGDVGLDPTYPG
jgi:lipoprotein LpqB-like beta-propeller protein/sporulation and spore germination protein